MKIRYVLAKLQLVKPCAFFLGQSVLCWCHWATVCKTVRPMLSVLLVCLSVCNVGVLWPNGWMDQDMPLGTEVGLSPGHIVLDGNPAPHNNSPHFSAHVYCGQTVAHLSNYWALVFYMTLLSSVTSIIPPAGVRSNEGFWNRIFGPLKVVISLGLYRPSIDAWRNCLSGCSYHCEFRQYNHEPGI